MPRSTHFDHGYVVGLLVSDRLDSPDDADRLPDVVGATNVKPKFTRLQGQHKHPLRQPEHGAHGMLVSPVPIPAAVMADGHITGDVDASGRPLPDAQPGIWLIAGVHKVDLGGHFASFTIEVTTDHTETNPLDLYAASPYVPPTGTTMQTVLLPANGLPGQVLSRTEDGSLAWVEQTGGGATDHAALTGRAEPDQHPISSVTGLEDALDGKQPAGNYATNPALTAEAQARQAADSTLSDAIALRQTAAQVDARVQQVVGAAPAALDTLGEIAERLADDADAVSALTSAVAGKADAEHNHNGVYVKPADVSDVVREGDARLTDARTPTAHDHPVTDLDATGTPSASTYLRGDGAWAIPEGGGTPVIASPGPARWLAPYNILRSATVSAAQASPAMYLVTHATDFIGMDIRVEGGADPNPGSMIRLDVYRLSETLNSGTLMTSTPETPLTTRGVDLFMTMPIFLEPGVYIVHLARNSAADSAVVRSCAQALPTRWGAGSFNETTISDVNGFYIQNAAPIGSPAAEVVTLNGAGYYSGSGPRTILAGFRNR